jgi:hypothetical protein
MPRAYSLDLRERVVGLVASGEPCRAVAELFDVSVASVVIACPEEALRAWLEAAGIQEGAVFRPINKSSKVASSRLSDRSVANIVKAYAKRRGSIRRSFPVIRYARDF